MSFVHSNSILSNLKMNFHSNFQSIYNSENLSITTTTTTIKWIATNSNILFLIVQISNKQIETIQSKKMKLIDFVFEHTILFVCSQHVDNEQQSQQQIEWQHFGVSKQIPFKQDCCSQQWVEFISFVCVLSMLTILSIVFHFNKTTQINTTTRRIWEWLMTLIKYCCLFCFCCAPFSHSLSVNTFHTKSHLILNQLTYLKSFLALFCLFLIFFIEVLSFQPNNEIKFFNLTLKIISSLYLLSVWIVTLFTDL
jgi:uncharacterized membrane protein